VKSRSNNLRNKSPQPPPNRPRHQSNASLPLTVHHRPLQSLTKIGIVLLVLAVLVAILQFLVGQRTRCPLCMAPVLAPARCSKHRHSRTLFGSHRLRVAVAIFFRNSFRCPYCNESAELEVRTRRHRGGLG
jgi:hypothetical protein